MEQFCKLLVQYFDANFLPRKKNELTSILTWNTYQTSKIVGEYVIKA